MVTAKLILPLFLLLMVGWAVLAYGPYRKRLLCLLDPAWWRTARSAHFTLSDVAREETDLLLWREAIKNACDVVWERGVNNPPRELLGPLSPGTSVHVNARNIPAFIDKVLPQLQTPVVLVSGCETVNTDVTGYERIIESPKILCWYLQNFALDESHATSGRVVKLPLGFDFHTLNQTTRPAFSELGLAASTGHQQLELKRIRNSIAPLCERPLRVYMNFHLSMDTMLRAKEALKRRKARLEAYTALRVKPFVWAQPRQMPRIAVWRAHKDFAFEASPVGNGLDCFRTWEAIALKTIPIVKTSPLDSLYEGLPVVIVNDWEEVTEDNLGLWADRFAELVEAPLPSQLYTKHWIDLIRSHR